MNELKKCPFCGGEAHIVYNAKRKNIYGKDGKYCVIYCDNCFVEMTYPTVELAIKAWNRRIEVAE